MVWTLLHPVAVGNLLPASCKTVCVDINPSSVTKLTDRGSHQTLGIVMDASSFLRELTLAIESAEANERALEARAPAAAANDRAGTGT